MKNVAVLTEDGAFAPNARGSARGGGGCWAQLELTDALLLTTTLVRLSKNQRFINTMYNRGEIAKQEKKEMRPKSATTGRALGLPVTHKQFDSIPKFRPIIDTTNTPYYVLILIVKPFNSQ